MRWIVSGEVNDMPLQGEIAAVSSKSYSVPVSDSRRKISLHQQQRPLFMWYSAAKFPHPSGACQVSPTMGRWSVIYSILFLAKTRSVMYVIVLVCVTFWHITINVQMLRSVQCVVQCTAGDTSQSNNERWGSSFEERAPGGIGAKHDAREKWWLCPFTNQEAEAIVQWGWISTIVWGGLLEYQIKGWAVDEIQVGWQWYGTRAKCSTVAQTEEAHFTHTTNPQKD